MAKFLVAHVYSVVLGDERVLTNGSFIESIDLKHLRFDPVRMLADFASHKDSDQKFMWNLNPYALAAFSSRRMDVTDAQSATDAADLISEHAGHA
jgi:hypothetical protein